MTLPLTHHEAMAKVLAHLMEVTEDNKRLRTQLSAVYTREEHERVVRERDTLRTQLAKAESFIKKIEWTAVEDEEDDPKGPAYCFICDNCRDLGHKPDCELSAALGKTGGRE